CRPWPAPSPPSATPILVFFEEGADLGKPAADTGETLDRLLGFPSGAGRVGQEVILQRALMLVQLALLAAPGEAADLLQAALLELVEVTLHRTRRYISQGGYLRVSEPLVFQPQHFHLLLHARMRMMKTLVANLLDDLLAELEGTHGCRFPFASFASAMLYGIEPGSTTLPDSAAGSIYCRRWRTGERQRVSGTGDWV